MAFNLKSLFKERSDNASVGEVGQMAALDTGSRTHEQLIRILGVVLVISLLLTAATAYVQIRDDAHASAYSRLAAQLQLLAQKVPQAIQSARRGESGSFPDLGDARGQFNQLIVTLRDGGVIQGLSLPPTSSESRASLDALIKVWTPQDVMITQLLAQAKPFTALGRLVNESVAKGPSIILAAETTGGRLPYLTERVLRAISQLGLAPDISELAMLQLARDLAAARELAPAGGSLDKSLAALQEAYIALPSDIRPLAQARTAAARLGQGAKELESATDELIAAYGREVSAFRIITLTTPVFGSVALVTLVLLVFYYNNDAARRREEAEARRRAAEADREVTQNAILRLLNEMSDLADGDLTVRTTVTEDITGAIADSVNFAIEELATLVRRLNDAAERVTHTTDRAQVISRELLAATETQAGEIRQVSSSVLATADSMGVVSVSAQESAKVALASVDAAQRGASAVADSISGMNEIRGQIQETSKRIKRLGESSQEIGEIVELISDITEQTNVLALNAAIQAASAGEAGRGFSVVAEEVQRLAERSAGATKQIAALVKTIQTDTHDAVAAMEKSTQGVVEGTKLSDAAGQSLAEISSVSQDLAQRVTTIAGATQTQAKTATEVAVSMKSILEITDQTTAGTQQTARSVAELAALATELKGSVAGFKV
ncbi:MAG: methyl-accepting chemotaxis protein [Rugosibacter sp.]|nr:methyl-accepting chemotaxis protein [Rugosibacter sp.]